MTEMRPDQHASTTDDTGTPRWVKVFGIIGVVLVLLIAVLMFAGHGPGRHLSSDGHGRSHAQLAGTTH